MSIPFNPLEHPDAEIPRGFFCQLAGCARITAYRRERNDPSWPRPIVRGKRVFYKSADCKRYLNSGGPSSLTA
jgi:hypothetical protein